MLTSAPACLVTNKPQRDNAQAQYLQHLPRNEVIPCPNLLQRTKPRRKRLRTVSESKEHKRVTSAKTKQKTQKKLNKNLRRPPAMVGKDDPSSDEENVSCDFDRFVSA